MWDANNQPGVFANLKTLTYDDRIQINAQGSTYSYAVRENRLITKHNMDAVFKHEELDWITLVTCEDYDPASGEYLFRRMVRAVLVRVD